MRVHGAVHPQRVWTDIQDRFHYIKIKSSNRRGWRRGMSEPQNGNDAQIMTDRKGSV